MSDQKVKGGSKGAEIFKKGKCREGGGGIISYDGVMTI